MNDGGGRWRAELIWLIFLSFEIFIKFVIRGENSEILIKKFSTFFSFQKADLAICDLTITYERRTAVDFTMPFMTLGEWIIFQVIVISLKLEHSVDTFQLSFSPTFPLLFESFLRDPFELFNRYSVRIIVGLKVFDFLLLSCERQVKLDLEKFVVWTTWDDWKHQKNSKREFHSVPKTLSKLLKVHSNILSSKQPKDTRVNIF